MPLNRTAQSSFEESLTSPKIQGKSVPEFSALSVHDAVALDRKRSGSGSCYGSQLLKKRRCDPKRPTRLLDQLAPLLSLDFLGDLGTNHSHWSTVIVPTKRVTFDLSRNTSAPCSDSKGDTWYNDVDYHRFQLDSRKAVMAARHALMESTSDDLDDAILLGLERFMSPSIERAREQHCRTHVQLILALEQERRRPRRRGALSIVASF